MPLFPSRFSSTFLGFDVPLSTFGLAGCPACISRVDFQFCNVTANWSRDVSLAAWMNGWQIGQLSDYLLVWEFECACGKFKRSSGSLNLDD